ncbi:response regulator transcription factor [Shewanella carassii]|nr:helix-turn-helix transcriptional regulator [Shewanella carassii]
MSTVIDKVTFAETNSSPLEVLQTVSPLIARLGFKGFWFRGLPCHAKESLEQPESQELFAPVWLRKPIASLASTSRIAALQQFYLEHFARSDSNFVESLSADKAWRYRWQEGDPVKKLFTKHGYDTVLSFPVPSYANPTWFGRFMLLGSGHPDPEPERLQQTLILAQSLLFEHDRQRFNPFLQSRIFKANARKVLRMAATGLQNHEISDRLHISVRGVEYHMESMRKKLGASNRANLIHLAHQFELI